MKDVLITSVLTNGRDDFRTGRKVAGNDVKVGELAPEQQREYFRPFIESSQRYGVEAVVLHDGMREIVRAGLPVRFCCAVALPGWNAFERRWVAILNYLHARDDIERVWIVDANDVLFTTHSFQWMDSYLGNGQIAVGQEQVKMGGNDWFEAGVKPLPKEYGDTLTKRYGHEYGLTCGCWGANRSTAIAVMTDAVQRIEVMQQHIAKRNPEHPVCLDMFAFNVVFREHLADVLVPFSMDGESIINGVSSPLVHDRTKCMNQINGVA